MKNTKVLVIDDDPDVFETIQDCLEGMCQLFHANNGLEGLKMYKEVVPELIILDIRMPVMDGLEFLKKICIAPDDLFSVIVLTGHAQGKEIEEFFNMGITSFIRKPFDFFELKGQVKQSILSRSLLKHLAVENKMLVEMNNEWEIAFNQMKK